MTSFHRPPQGLANYALFYGVDAVVFLEGGPRTWTLAEVCAGQCSDVSEDIRYWQVVFGKLFEGKSLRFRGVGSKATLLDIADVLSQVVGDTVMIAMDRDADALRGDIRTGRSHVYYTWGYSWENDLAFPALVAEATLMLCPVDRAEHRAGLGASVAANQAAFLDSARRYVVADALLNTATREALFDRQNAKKYVGGRGDPRLVPSFSEGNLRARLRAKNLRYRHMRPRTSPRHSLDAHRDCYGHLLGTLSLSLIRHSAKTLGESIEGLSHSICTSLLCRALDDLWGERTLTVLRDYHMAQTA